MANINLHGEGLTSKYRKFSNARLSFASAGALFMMLEGNVKSEVFLRRKKYAWNKEKSMCNMQENE